MIGDQDSKDYNQNQRGKDFVTMNVNDLQGARKNNQNPNSYSWNNFPNMNFPGMNMQNMAAMQQMQNMNNLQGIPNMNMVPFGLPPFFSPMAPPSNLIEQPFIH